MKTDTKIDLVYLWVDDTDKNLRAQKDKWLEIIKGQKPVYADAAIDARWRDNGEFRYSLRSVEKHMSWVNHIYIITLNLHIRVKQRPQINFNISSI